MNITTIISVHLGTGQEGRRRKAALEALAEHMGLVWNGKPSIGRLVCYLADQGAQMELAKLKEMLDEQDS